MRIVRWLAFLAAAAATVLATVVGVFALQSRRLPELHAWHTAIPPDEFHAGAASTFAEYQAIEKRLFARLPLVDTQRFSRYNPHSIVARLALETPYNRSFELAPAGEPRGAALLVHGLTDSPYAMRALGETLFKQGYYVLALRLPGHGTVPAGLVDVTWQDWYAAVVLAARHVKAKAGAGKPFVAGGHSTGAALVTLLALRALSDSEVPRPQRLYLVSPAIGISPFARLTNIVSSLAFVPGLEKSRWLDVLPEYDPYKYNSFPVNAARQIYALTQVLQRTLDEEGKRKRLDRMPGITAFQSIVDATVTVPAVVSGLLGRLPPKEHELVLFDINRNENLDGWIAPGRLEDLEKVRAAVNLPFRLTLIANRGPDTRAVAAYTRAPGESSVRVEDLPYEWPRGVFSVGHVSLPFPPDDPVYGLEGGQFNLGALAPKGEAGALVVAPGTFERLRANPLWGVIEAKVVETERSY